MPQPGIKTKSPMGPAVDCRFCQIITGDQPSCRVYEDPRLLVFLDHRPLFPGHCLLVPRLHCPTLSEVPPELIDPLFRTTQLLGRVLPKALEAEGTFVAINNRVSQSVPHLHVHVVPRRKGDGLKGFFWPRHPYRDQQHMDQVAERLRNWIQDEKEAEVGDRKRRR